MSVTSNLKRLVEARLRVTNSNAFDAARRGGLTRTFIDDILRERKMTVRGDSIEQLAKALYVTPHDIHDAMVGMWNETWEDDSLVPDFRSDELPLIEGERHPVETRLYYDNVRAYLSPRRLERGAPNRLVPIMGTALGSIIGGAFSGTNISDEAIDYVPCPPALLAAANVFAAFVAGESMRPMHQPGDLVFYSPHRMPLPGDTVVVETKAWSGNPAQAYIKTLRAQRDGAIILEQLNQPATIEIPLSAVSRYSRVFKTRELFGV